jgi:5-methylcytosine-specific restriction endonuclease McrA
MNHCLNCGKETANPKYCSRSCAAQSTNRLYPKRKKRRYYCQTCGIKVPPRRKYCDSCNPHNVDWDMVSLSDLQDKRGYQINSRVRELARRAYLASGRPQRCAVCDYDKHVDVCHIKPISSFPLTSTIGEINSLQNLIALCPNCHWELDNGLLSL